MQEKGEQADKGREGRARTGNEQFYVLLRTDGKTPNRTVMAKPPGTSPFP